MVSQARVDLDGRPPEDIAATAYIPLFPTAQGSRRYAVVAAFDAWRRRWRLVMAEALPGIPGSLWTISLNGRQDAVIFPTYGDEGIVRYQVVTIRSGRLTTIYSGEILGRVEVRRDMLVQVQRVNGAEQVKALRWNGRAFVSAPVPPPIPPSVSWRYRVDASGKVRAATHRITLKRGQTFRLVREGGGPTAVIVPDLRLDQHEAGFRGRRAGLYPFRVVTGVPQPGDAFVLTVQITNDD